METPVDRLNKAWNNFREIYQEEAPLIREKVEDNKPKGDWIIRIHDNKMNLVIQDVSFMPSYANVTMDEANKMFKR